MILCGGRGGFFVCQLMHKLWTKTRGEAVSGRFWKFKFGRSGVPELPVTDRYQPTYQGILPKHYSAEAWWRICIHICIYIYIYVCMYFFYMLVWTCSLASFPNSVIYLAGDSSLDNKFWFSQQAVALNGYENMLDPPTMKTDVCFAWL